MSEAGLNRICKRYKFDLGRFGHVLPLPGQTTYDPPKDYEAVYEEYFKSGFNLPVPEPFVRILRSYNLRLPQIKPNGLKLILCYLLFLRITESPFHIHVFRGLFSCRISDSWYYFAKRVSNSELNLAMNIPSFTKNWKGKFFYIKKDELPK